MASQGRMGFDTILCLLLVFCCVSASVGENDTNADLTFNVGKVEVTLRYYPTEIYQLETGKVSLVYLNFTSSNGNEGTQTAKRHANNQVTLRVEPEDSDIAEIVGSSEIVLDVTDSMSETNITLQVKALFLGVTYLKFLLKDDSGGFGYAPHPNQTAPHSAAGEVPYTQTSVDIPFTSDSQSFPNDHWKELSLRYKVVVIREKRAVDTIFVIMVALMVAIANIGMGCKIDLGVVKEVLRRPIAPIIGFLCQFIIMPLVAFALLKALKLDGGQALGFFAAGCAPGGGASNMYTYLLDGDVSLSVTMTLLSTIGSLGMIPLWLFSLGQLVMEDAHQNIKIPYQNIIISLVSILVPVGIGILIQRYRPRVSKMIIKLLRPGFIIFLIFMFTFGVWANQYVFRLFTVLLIVAGCLLPYIGFVLGGAIAAVCRQPWPRIKTIGIETGIQNTGIPIILMRFSLPQPYADLAMVAPIVVATFTPIPMLIAVAYREIRKRCCKKKSEEAQGFSYIDNHENDSDLETRSDHHSKETNGNILHVEGASGAVRDKEMVDMSDNTALANHQQ